MNIIQWYFNAHSLFILLIFQCQIFWYISFLLFFEKGIMLLTAIEWLQKLPFTHLWFRFEWFECLQNFAFIFYFQVLEICYKNCIFCSQFRSDRAQKKYWNHRMVCWWRVNSVGNKMLDALWYGFPSSGKSVKKCFGELLFQLPKYWLPCFEKFCVKLIKEVSNKLRCAFVGSVRWIAIVHTYRLLFIYY